MFLTHVDKVLVVSDPEVPVDPVLVDVGDDGHVRDAVIRTTTCVREYSAVVTRKDRKHL